MLKLKINIILPQLLCFVVPAARNGEFQRFREFWVDCYYSSYKGDKGGKLIFDRFSAKPIFHPEIRIAWLPNRTTDKLKGWRLFSWYSIEDPFKIQALTAIKFSRNTAFGAISCVKEQQSRCLLHADWMFLNDASNQRGANSVTVFCIVTHHEFFANSYWIHGHATCMGALW